MRFSVLTEKEVKKFSKMEKTYLQKQKQKQNQDHIDKNHILKSRFVDRGRFTESWLSNLANNLADEIHRMKCKYGHDNKNVKHGKKDTKTVSAILNTQIFSIIFSSIQIFIS